MTEGRRGKDEGLLHTPKTTWYTPLKKDPHRYTSLKPLKRLVPLTGCPSIPYGFDTCGEGIEDMKWIRVNYLTK